MAKQQERAELHKTIWKIANDLRGSVDGWEFKAYVLGSIFYRFISENICDYIHQLMTDAGQPDFDYAEIDDEMAENIRQKMVEEKGYFILPSQLFQNVVARCEKDENLNETLSAIFRSIEASAVGTDSEDDLRGLFSDFTVDSAALGSTVIKRNQLLWHLSEQGTAAIVEFPGVLYRGGDEKKIRQYLIKNNYVDTVIQLPANLFLELGSAADAAREAV